MSSRHILRLSKLTNKGSFNLTSERKKNDDDEDYDNDEDPVMITKPNYYNVYSSSSDSDKDSRDDDFENDSRNNVLTAPIYDNMTSQYDHNINDTIDHTADDTEVTSVVNTPVIVNTTSCMTKGNGIVSSKDNILKRGYNNNNKKKKSKGKVTKEIDDHDHDTEANHDGGGVEDKEMEYLDSIIQANVNQPILLLQHSSPIKSSSSSIMTTTAPPTTTTTINNNNIDAVGGGEAYTSTGDSPINCTIHIADPYNKLLPEVVNNQFFKIEDIKNLDIDNTLRRRFGQQNVLHLDDNNNNNNDLPQHHHHHHHIRQLNGGLRNHNRGVSKSNILSSTRKYLFCNQPKDSWVKPPSFISGGIGMVKVSSMVHNVSVNHKNNFNDNKDGGGSCLKELHHRHGSIQPDKSSYDIDAMLYSFEWSGEYRFLNKQYRYIQNSGDVNLLVMFLAHFPYHTAGLHELAMIYAKMGRIDRAFDLVRRGIYVYECSFLTSFKPIVTTNCRMDPKIDANRMFFTLLYRYMQMCGMQGCLGVAADVCRYLLSLHPTDDVHFLLLVLDYYLTAAGKHDVLLSYCNLHTDQLNSLSSSDYRTFSFHSLYIFHRWNHSGVDKDDHIDDDYHIDHDGTSNAPNPKHPHRSIEHLPNWWFSLALSRFLHEISESNKARSSSSSSSGTAIKASDFLLKAALFQWPFMLQTLITKAGIDLSTLASSVAKPWRDVFSHAFFIDATNRVPSDSYLLTICSIYTQRNSALWNREDVHKWVLQCAQQLIADMDKEEYSLIRRSSRNNNDMSYISVTLEEQIKRYQDISSNISSNPHNHHLNKYKHADIEEFREEYPRFPNDLEPIDPQLNDPNILDGGVKFQNFMDQQGRFLFPIHNLQQQQAGYNGDGDGINDDIVMGRNVMNMINANNVRDRRHNDHNRIDHDGMNRNHQRFESNIDLNLPLMQLFIATLFPWIYVGRRGERH